MNYWKKLTHEERGNRIQQALTENVNFSKDISLGYPASQLIVPLAIAEKYDLVPQQHSSDNQWYKIVMMDHVEVEHLTTFIQDLKEKVYA